MAGRRRRKIREPEITGLKYFKKLLPLLERLHDDGCARDKAGNRRLHFEHGIKIQTYCAIIACMLISLWTGRKPTLRTYEMICFSFCGLATEDELLAPIERLQMQPPDS